MKRTPHPDDLTMRYMERFRCIGGECEDTCCHTWGIVIDPLTLKRMDKLTLMHGEVERKRWLGALWDREIEGRVEKLIKLRPDGYCPLLEGNGLCHVHATFGEQLLSDTCAVYPRRLQVVGEALELSALVSCPEVARQVLLHADATEPAPLDRRTISRLAPTHGVDPRDVRPYWRLLLKVRTFMLSLLRRPGFSLTQRLFFMTWFCKRASPILNKSRMKADTTAVLAEMKALESDEMLTDLAQRFDATEASSTIALVLTRVLLSGRDLGRRDKFLALVGEVFGEYIDVRAYLPGDQASPEADSHAARLWSAYSKRRDRVMELAGERVDQYLVNMAHNYWMQRLPLEAPDLMVHMLRLLTLQAVFKFLLFSHPSVQADGDDFQTRLDAAAVQILYREARYIEHSRLLKELENMLDKMQLRSFAGAIYLIRL